MKHLDKSLIIQSIINNAIVLVGRNACGNKLILKTSMPIDEKYLRDIERAILFYLHQIVTVYWEKTNSEDPAYASLDLEFDAKLPYDRYPLQDLLEGGLKK